MYINGQEFEWLEDPKHLATIIRNRSKVRAKPGKLYQQDTGISIYVSSGRFDIQFCVKRLIEMMTKLGNLQKKLVLGFDHQEYGDTVRIAVNSDLFHARRAGILWRTSRGFVGCIRSSASIEFQRSRAQRNRGLLGTRNLHKALYEEMGRTVNIDVETDSTAAIGMCSRTGVGKTRHIQVRWLWIQDAIRDKVVRLRKRRQRS